MKQKQVKTYNDGVLRLYNRKDIRSQAGAKVNIQSMHDLEYVCSIDYRQKSCRQEDYEFADQMGKQLSYKLVTPYSEFPSTKMIGKINSKLYSIINIDQDRINRELYFYLEEVRTIDEGDT